MPIIRAGKMADGLAGVDYKGDKFKFTHVQDIEDIAANCKELRKDGNNGFSKDRGFRLIARIPSLAFFERKELTNPDGTVNKKNLKKYLSSPEGEMFKTVNKGI